MERVFWITIGLMAAGLTTFSFIPQIIKVFRSKSADDVSRFTLLQLMSGVFLWIIYGIYLRDLIIIAANSITFVSLVILMFFCVKYSSRKRGGVNV